MQPSKEWLEKMGDLEDQVACVSVGVDPHPWRSWFCRTFFPSKHCFAPEAPSEFKDCVTVHSITKLGFIDRLRCLVTGVVIVTTRTVTENEVGRTVTASTCHIGLSAKDW